MTAEQVIETIESLPREDRARVIEFARAIPMRKPLTPDELYKLGERMLTATDQAEAERLRQELVKGFYGEE